jgi:hypothetical protein
MLTETEQLELLQKVHDLEARDEAVTKRVSGLYDILKAWQRAGAHKDVRWALLNPMTAVERDDLELATNRFLAGQGYDYRELDSLRDLVKALRQEVTGLRQELHNHGFKAHTPGTEL